MMNLHHELLTTFSLEFLNPRASNKPNHIPYLQSDYSLWAVSVILAGLLLGVNFVRTWRRYHSSYQFQDSDKLSNQTEIPALLPSLIPFIGNVISFSWDTASFIRYATTYANISRPCRVSIFPGFQIYLFQDRETIKQILKHPNIGSTVPVYLFVLRRFFGMPERTIKVYKADNSGLGSKPLQGSNVEPDSRPFHVTHKDLTYGLTGPGLGPNVRRYIGGYAKHVQLYGDGRLCKTSPHSSGWIEFPDLFHFTQHTVGCAIISAHFGSDLLRIHSGFMDDLWAVDAGFPWFARCVPRFLRPGPYRARDRLISNLMDWYAYARDRFDGSAIDEDGDGDPAWGSGLSRRRQKTLREIREHDDRAIASLDLGHSWGSTVNITSTIFMATYYVFSSGPLLSRLRTSLTKTLGTNRIHNKPNDSQPDKNILDLLDPKVLQSNSLLCSIYAETLRLHGTSHLIFRASADAHLGRWLLPRGSIGLISPGVLHQDAKFWNTCDGQHPISEFWSDRFLVYPNDPNSGPVSPVYRDISYSSPKKRQDNVDNDNNQPYFTMDGTEGAWYPYGGGEGICLGRFLAKNSILATLAYLVLEFDIEPQVESMVVNSWRFGLSVNQPRYTTPFKIRRRPSDKE